MLEIAQTTGQHSLLQANWAWGLSGPYRASASIAAWIALSPNRTVLVYLAVLVLAGIGILEEDEFLDDIILRMPVVVWNPVAPGKASDKISRMMLISFFIVEFPLLVGGGVNCVPRVVFGEISILWENRQRSYRQKWHTSAARSSVQSHSQVVISPTSEKVRRCKNAWRTSVHAIILLL